MKLEDFLRVVRRIPRGSVMTYGEVAEAAGHKGGARQVVWALNQPAAGVPWHRVVGAGLKIRLAGEAGLEQRLRLESEGWVVNGARLVLNKRADAKVNPPKPVARKKRATAG